MEQADSHLGSFFGSNQLDHAAPSREGSHVREYKGHDDPIVGCQINYREVFLSEIVMLPNVPARYGMIGPS
jgi:hypothetical protein